MPEGITKQKFLDAPAEERYDSFMASRRSAPEVQQHVANEDEIGEGSSASGFENSSSEVRLYHNLCCRDIEDVSVVEDEEKTTSYPFPRPFDCATFCWLHNSRLQQPLALLLTCRHTYSITLPMLYGSHMFSFDMHDDLSSLPSATFHTFCACLPKTQLASLRSIHQRVEVFTSLSEDKYVEQCDALFANLSVDDRWKTFVEGHGTTANSGLRGLPGLELLFLEFSLCSRKEAELARLRASHRGRTFAPLIRVFRGMKDLDVHDVQVFVAEEGGSCWEAPFFEAFSGILRARLLGLDESAAREGTSQGLGERRQKRERPPHS